MLASISCTENLIQDIPNSQNENEIDITLGYAADFDYENCYRYLNLKGPVKSIEINNKREFRFDLFKNLTNTKWETTFNGSQIFYYNEILYNSGIINKTISTNSLSDDSTVTQHFYDSFGNITWAYRPDKEFIFSYFKTSEYIIREQYNQNSDTPVLTITRYYNYNGEVIKDDYGRDGTLYFNNLGNRSIQMKNDSTFSFKYYYDKETNLLDSIINFIDNEKQVYLYDNFDEYGNYLEEQCIIIGLDSGDTHSNNISTRSIMYY